MSRRLTILVTSVTGVGHVNACIGATTELLLRGHRVIFVLERAWSGKLALLGFEEFIYSEAEEEDSVPPKNDEKPGQAMAAYLLAAKSIGPYSPEEKMKSMTTYFKSAANRSKFARCNAAIKKAIDRYQPDLIWVDGGLRPAVRQSGIKWIWCLSAHPGFLIMEPDLPPGGFGLPTEGDRSQWEYCNSIRRQILFSRDYNDVVQQLGYERYPADAITPIEEASLVVYGFPDELNYPQIASKPWFNLQVFNRPPVDQQFQLTMLLPEEFMQQCLAHGDGKLILVTLGSMGSVDLELMQRLIGILEKTPHKYIISKGPRHEELILPWNMYGERYLPQQAILPHVDLVISHCGNNTVTECLAEGKPLLALPLFHDQFDTAQRLAETGLSIRLDAYSCTANQLIEAIEKMLYDVALHDRLKAISVRIKSTNRHKELAERIEQMFGGEK